MNVLFRKRPTINMAEKKFETDVEAANKRLAVILKADLPFIKSDILRSEEVNLNIPSHETDIKKETRFKCVSE